MISPKGWYILILPDDPFSKIKSDVIEIPDNVKEAREIDVNTGTIVSIGDLAWKDYGGEPWAKVGDRVIYVRYGGKRIQDPDNDVWYVLLNDKDVIGVLDGRE